MSEPDWVYRSPTAIFYWNGEWREIEDVYLPGDSRRRTSVGWDARINLHDTRRRHGQKQPARTWSAADLQAALDRLLADPGSTHLSQRADFPVAGKSPQSASSDADTVEDPSRDVERQ